MPINRRTPGGESGGSSQDQRSTTLSPGKRQAQPFNVQATAPQGVAQLVYRIAEAGYSVTGKDGHWMVQCPLHDDKEPSLGIDVHKRNDEPCGYRVLINCRQCGTIGQELCERFDIVWGNVLHHPDNKLLLEKPPPRPAPLPSEEDIEGWSKALTKTRIWRLAGLRLIDHRTLSEHRIGYDARRQCYTLPVYENGELANLRRYYEHRHPKMRGLTGRSIQLYPDVPNSDWLLLCEGELDALCGRAHGLPTVTSTGGACGWKAGWDDYVENRDVVIIYDCDDVGRRESAKRARMLTTIAKRIKAVDLAPERDDGYDLSDWFISGRTAKELRQLIRSVAPLGENRRGGQ